MKRKTVGSSKNKKYKTIQKNPAVKAASLSSPGEAIFFEAYWKQADAQIFPSIEKTGRLDNSTRYEERR
jgi:hypothetical protein